MGYAISQKRTGTFEQLTNALKAVLDHHSADHRLCGDWCPAMYWKDDKKVQKSLKYRCRMKDAKLYLQLKMHHNKFVTVKWVRDLIHEFVQQVPNQVSTKEETLLSDDLPPGLNVLGNQN
jgi:hypothetical protein